MQTLFTVFLAIHGAIHFIGFMKWGVPLETTQFGGTARLTSANTAPSTPSVPTHRAYAAFWLVCLAFLTVAAVTFAAGVTHWWVFALVGATLSQVLVFSAWSDAKYATLANVVVLLAVVSTLAGRGFERHVTDDVRRVFGSESSQSGGTGQTDTALGFELSVRAVDTGCWSDVNQRLGDGR